jgi:FMNH2-dependent dimethyl sulfone monooxygenase
MTNFSIGLFYPTATSIHTVSPLAKERNPDVLSASTHVAVIRSAEQAGLDYVFLADSWGGLGPVTRGFGMADPMLFAPTLAGVLIGASTRIRIITTMHQAWLHPLHVARIGANLDALSGGRWGMNCVSGAGFAPELLSAVTKSTGHDELYEAAAESMEIVLQAWHNDGEVDYAGRYFQAKGRLVGPGPVQRPHPLIVSAGASPAGCDFAGRFASTVFIPGRSDPAMIADRRERIRLAADRAGRNGRDIRVLLHASVIVGETQREAEELSAQLRASVDMQGVYEQVTGVGSQTTTYEELFTKYTEDGLRDIGHTGGTVKIHGDAEHVAAGIRDLRDATGCDGLSLSLPFWGPEQIQRFGEQVGPVLEELGVWSPERTVVEAVTAGVE